MHWNCSFLFFSTFMDSTFMDFDIINPARADIQNPFLWHFCLMSHDKNTLVLDRLATKLEMMTSHNYLGSFVLSTLADKKIPKTTFYCLLMKYAESRARCRLYMFSVTKMSKMFAFCIILKLKKKYENTCLLCYSCYLSDVNSLLCYCEGILFRFIPLKIQYPWYVYIQ